MRDILPSGAHQDEKSPLKGADLNKVPSKDWVRILTVGGATCFMSGILCASGVIPQPVLEQNSHQFNRLPVHIVPAETQNGARKSRRLRRKAKPEPTPDAHTGPFRAGMKTAFSNVTELEPEMAELMNIHYDILRHKGYTKNAALALTIPMIRETAGGTELGEKNAGDGAGSIQFSQWNGDGDGRELTWLQKPGAGRPWQRNDFIAREDGGTLTKVEAVTNSAIGIDSLLRNYRHYRHIEKACRDPDMSIPSLAMLISKDFIRQAESNDLRTKWITQTYQMNQHQIERNIGLGDFNPHPEKQSVPLAVRP